MKRHTLLCSKIFVPIIATAGLLIGVISPMPSASAADTPTLQVYQTTLGNPSGDPQGNVYVSGSAAPFLAARDAAIAGTLTSRTTYTPAESSIWGTGGAFGSELYMFSVVKNIPVGSLLGITKSGDYKDISTPNWTPGFTSYTTYYPMIAYTHTTSTTAYGYLTKFDCSATLCTFVTGASLAEDYSASTPNGSANTPPTDISQTIGFQFRHRINAKVITGNYTLTGASTHTRGYQQGTGYTGGDAPIDLGTPENISSVPQRTTVYVDPAYTTASCGGHECYYDAFAKIQDGVNAVASGGTVNVAAGTYTEQINISKSLTLTGAGTGTTHINTPDPSTMTIYDAFGSKSSTPRYSVHRGADIPVVRIASSNVTFQGFDVNLGDKAFWDVKGSFGTNYSRSTGILVDHVETVPGTPDVFTNVKIQNNKVDGMLAGDKGDAIKALGNATVTIQNNTIYAYGESGISAVGSEDFPSFSPAYHPTVTADSNTIYGSSSARPGTNYFFGIGYWVGATGTADGNTIYNAPNSSGNALNSWTTMPVSFTHNTITTDGGSVGGVGAQLYQSSSLIFSNNTIENQGLAGAIWSNPTITMSGNTVTNSTDGFLIDNQTSGSVKINNNSISGIPGGHHAVIVGGDTGTDSGTIWGTWGGPSSVVVDATNNWWGSAVASTIAAGIVGSVTWAPYYMDSGLLHLNTDAPSIASASITGIAKVGSTVNAGHGVITGSPTPSLTYVWSRDGVAISGATNSSYVLVTADLGKAITVTITASNGVGSDATATSVATAAVVGADHTVTFNSNGGNGSMTNQTASVSTSLTANSFTLSSYVFAGWNKSADGTGTAYADGAAYAFATDTTLYAQWILSEDAKAANAARGKAAADKAAADKAAADKAAADKAAADKAAADKAAADKAAADKAAADKAAADAAARAAASAQADADAKAAAAKASAAKAAAAKAAADSAAAAEAAAKAAAKKAPGDAKVVAAAKDAGSSSAAAKAAAAKEAANALTAANATTKAAAKVAAASAADAKVADAKAVLAKAAADAAPGDAQLAADADAVVAAAKAVADKAAADAAAAKAAVDKAAAAKAAAAKAATLAGNDAVAISKSSGGVTPVKLNMPSKYAGKIVSVELAIKVNGKWTYKIIGTITLNAAGDATFKSQIALPKGSVINIKGGTTVIQGYSVG